MQFYKWDQDRNFNLLTILASRTWSNKVALKTMGRIN